MATVFVKEFTHWPMNRFGPEGAVKFVNQRFIPLYEKDKLLMLNLDGTIGYTSPFLEELAHVIVRYLHLTPNANLMEEIETIVNNIVSTEDPSVTLEIKGYVKLEMAKLALTIKHEKMLVAQCK